MIYNYQQMQRKITSSLNQVGGNIKSSFISQYSPEHKEPVSFNLTSRKQLSSSTYLDLEEARAKFATTRKLSRMETQFVPQVEDINRARSLKNIDESKYKPSKAVENNPKVDLNENTLKLRTQQLLFKLKVKFCTLLQELGINQVELNKFNKIGRVDDIIFFLSEKVRNKVAEEQKIRITATQERGKDRDSFQKCHSELQNLKNQINTRQAIEKQLRSKLKQANTQIKAILDRLNFREKEYSQRVSESYQLKVQMKQNDRLIEVLKAKTNALERERLQLRSVFDSETKDNSGVIIALRQQNKRLEARVEELRQEVDRALQKQAKLQDLNEHLNQELTRWRERIDYESQTIQSDGKQKSSEGTPQTPNDYPLLANQLKKSTMSMSNSYINNFNSSIRVQTLTALEVENTKLKLQVKELTKQNEQLNRNYLNHATFKERYEETLDGFTDADKDISKGLDSKRLDLFKERSSDLYKLEIEGFYKRKTQQIARQWKQKLYDVVYKYQDEIQLLKKNVKNLKYQKEILQKKVLTLANDKYQSQTKLIELQKEFYSSQRSNKSIISLIQTEENHDDVLKSDKKFSDELIISKNSLNMIEEEQSPNRNKNQDSERNSLSQYRQSSQKQFQFKQ